MINPPPAIYGIIGNPVAHSLSPVMHNAAFKALHVNAVYKLFCLRDEEELKLFMEDLKEADNPIFGLNVTVPYKEKVLPFVDSLNPLSQKIGAVNTLVIDHQRKIRGFNTDGPGFLSHLTELKFDLKGKRVAILGAGGTARAIMSVLCLLQEQGPQSIKIFNRTLAHAQNLLREIQAKINTNNVSIAANVQDLNFHSLDLLINTTNVGMKEEDLLLINPDLIHKNMLVYDVIYRPRATKLLLEAQKRGARYANGLGMLYFQGVLAFAHWADIEPDDRVKKIMRQSLEEVLRGP